MQPKLKETESLADHCQKQPLLFGSGGKFVGCKGTKLVSQ